MASKNESKTLAIAVVTLVAFVGLMVWMLAGPSEDAAPADPVEESANAEAPTLPARPAAAPKAQPAATAQKPEAEPSPVQAALSEPDVDLFAGQMPDFMVELHARVLDKKWLSAPEQKQLYDFGQAHKDDARPQLLLAWDSMHRDWDGIAVRMYRIAYHADRRSKYDPSMLRDLLALASKHDHTEYREATQIIEEAYGAEALPRIEESISRLNASGDMAGVDRLSRLRDALRGH